MLSLRQDSALQCRYSHGCERALSKMRCSMDLSQYPELLQDKRGPIDGRQFFSRSPFLSGHFLVASGMNLACIAMELFLVFHHAAKISPSTELFFAVLGIVILLSWLGTLRHIRRLRALYLEGLVREVEAGSPLDVALGVAAGEIVDWLLCISAAIMMMLIYIGTHFDCLNSR